MLGPSLFTIYISDIPTLHNTKIAQFADDTAIYAESFSAEIAYRKLMIHNRYLQDYFKKWKIKLNNIKTPNADLKPVKQVKYLGMILDSRLSFVPHITKAVKAAYADMLLQHGAQPVTLLILKGFYCETFACFLHK